MKRLFSAKYLFLTMGWLNPETDDILDIMNYMIRNEKQTMKRLYGC